MAVWLYMMNMLRKIFIIDHEEIQFYKNYWWTLIEIPDEPNVSMSDHEYSGIYDDLFDRIQSTYQYNNIPLKII